MITLEFIVDYRRVNIIDDSVVDKLLIVVFTGITIELLLGIVSWCESIYDTLTLRSINYDYQQYVQLDCYRTKTQGKLFSIFMVAEENGNISVVQ